MLVVVREVLLLLLHPGGAFPENGTGRIDNRTPILAAFVPAFVRCIDFKDLTMQLRQNHHAHVSFKHKRTQQECQKGSR